MSIYLDNAATSFPKPEPVYQAIDAYARNVGIGAGRGSFQRANNVARMVEQTRNQVAQLINAPSSKNISFAYSGTDALSTAIFGFAQPGDQIVTTVADHTSVIRPLARLAKEKGCSIATVPCDSAGAVFLEALESAINKDTDLVCVSHASNVTGTIQPIDEIQSLCKAHGAALLVDAAQTIGHLPIDVQTMRCDFLAAPGHKGMLGPLGTGVLYVADNVADRTTPLRYGGTGSSHVDEGQPLTCPDKFESGNLNIHGIAGMNAALKWLATSEARERNSNLESLCEKLTIGLKSIDGVKVFASSQKLQSAPVISFALQGLDCQTIAMALDSQFGIECRAGLHCAPLLHKAIGSAASGGLVRFSPGVFTTDAEIETAINSIDSIASSLL